MAAAAAEGAEGGQGGGLDPADPYSEAEIASMMVHRALDHPALLEAEEQSQVVELAARGDAVLSTRKIISDEASLSLSACRIAPLVVRRWLPARAGAATYDAHPFRAGNDPTKLLAAAGRAPGLQELGRRLFASADFLFVVDLVRC